MRRRHAISPGLFGHYQDLGIPSLKRPDSAVCNLILAWCHQVRTTVMGAPVDVGARLGVAWPQGLHVEWLVQQAYMARPIRLSGSL